ncbi:MAG: COQ9 family protein [Proteobacteria bacterium]|nr:COQ9 family protein [Pseudomonadota bacterium]
MSSPNDYDGSGEAGFDRPSARAKLIEAALTHVPFDGWTQTALQAGARDVGFPPAMALRLFPRGATEAVEVWCGLGDRRMMAEIERRDVSTLKTRERVALAVRLRLEPEARHREAIRRSLGLFALPHNAPLAAVTLWRTIDAIWYAAGDTATDFNYYTKRALLVGVYSATLLYWLDDKSPDAADSWVFLDRRIAEILRVPKALGALQERLGQLPNPFRAFWARR